MGRTVFEDASVQEIIDMYLLANPKLTTAWEGLKWVLSRNPSLGVCISFADKNWYLYRSLGLEGNPDILVLYDFDANTVNFHNIKVFAELHQAEIHDIRTAKA